MLNRKKQFANLSLLKIANLLTLVISIFTTLGLMVVVKKNLSLSKIDISSSVNVKKKSQAVTPSPVLIDMSQQVSLSNSLLKSKQKKIEYASKFITPKKFKKSQKLQAIVDDVIALATANKLPNKSLSVTLIDTKTRYYAGYQQKVLRYPASVVKMFWMVYFYAQAEKGTLEETDFTKSLKNMIKKSDNYAASHILDTITDTKSGEYIKGKKYTDWLKKRLKVNKFFHKAGYEKIYLSQKTFPVSQNFYRPKGSDLRMQSHSKKRIHNNITSQHAATLLYEIYKGRTFSANSNQKMKHLLTIDAQTRSRMLRKPNIQGFNPVRGYLSQSLPSNVYFGGKAGWTSRCRGDAGYIATPDGKTAYILVLFGEDPAYSRNWNIFPKMSRLVFNRMKNYK